MLLEPQSRARQREGRAGEPDALAQIARQHAVVRRQLDRRDIGADGTHAVGFRALQQHGRGRRRDHRGGREVGRPVVVHGAIDHRAVAEPVGGHDDGAVDLAFLLFVRGGHAATCAFRNSSVSRHGFECATTSPMTSSAGPSPAAAASFGKIVETADHGARVGARAAREHGGRRRRIAPGLDQPVAHRGGRGEAHIDHHRRLLAGEAGPVDARGLVGAMGGDEGEPRRLVAEGERQLGLGGAAERSGDAGNDDDGDILLAQALDLFAAAAEHEGIAALETNHLAAGSRGVDQPAVDLVLADAGLAAALADEHALGVAPHAVEHRVGDELVVEYDIGVLQHLQRAQRQQVGIARAGAHQEHGAGRAARIASAAGVDAAHEIGLGADVAAGEHRRADRTVHDLLPEQPRRQCSWPPQRGGDSGPSGRRDRRCAPARSPRCVRAAAAPAPAHGRWCRSPRPRRRDRRSPGTRRWRGRRDRPRSPECRRRGRARKSSRRAHRRSRSRPRSRRRDSADSGSWKSTSSLPGLAAACTISSATSVWPGYQRTVACAASSRRSLLIACSPEPTSATGPLVTSMKTGRKRIAKRPENLLFGMKIYSTVQIPQ